MSCGRCVVTVAVACVLTAGGGVFGETIWVPDDYATIQGAIDAAVDGDEIAVRPGTYNETVDFLGKAVRLYSTDGAEATVIDATGLDASVVTCSSGEGLDTVLEGFTVTGGMGTWSEAHDGTCGGGMFNVGASPTVTDCVFDGNGNVKFGGGMFNYGSSNPAVTNCTFIANTTGWPWRDNGGGGMYNDSSSPTISDCVFVANVCAGGCCCDCECGKGGGIYNINSSPSITDCVFDENVSGDCNEDYGGGGGIYNESSSPTVTNCTFTGNYGFSGGISNINSSPTVTGCVFDGNHGYRGSGMYNGSDSNAVITSCTFTGNHIGGGMYNESSSPTVTNCTFTGNRDGRGGMENRNSSPIVTGCAFTGNTADGMSNEDSSPAVTSCTFTGNSGSGMSNTDSHPTVIDCSFTNNTARGGGGMRNRRRSSPTVMDCRFVSNTAHGRNPYGGGGMFNEENSSPTVTNCTFIANVASGEEGIGGGMWNNYNSSATVTGCTFTENTAWYGGGILAVDRGLVVTNCTFMENHAEFFGGLYADEGIVTNCTFISNTSSGDDGDAVLDVEEGSVTNSILWNNTPRTIAGNVTVTYSDVQGGHEGIGNVDTDPLCDADGRPQAGSPCIDAGVNNAVPADTFDLDNDGDTAERLPLDLDGNPRFADDLDRDDTGCGVPVVVDMGAFEYQGVPVETVIVGDVDGDGVVDFADLLDVLEGWGECDADCCLADQDFNWVVDVREILLVLGNWG